MGKAGRGPGLRRANGGPRGPWPDPRPQPHGTDAGPRVAAGEVRRLRGSMEEKTPGCVEIRKLAPGESFKGIGVVQKLNRRSDKNGRPFWEVTLSDSTGSFDGKVWGDAAWWDLRDGGKTAMDPSLEA